MKSPLTKQVINIGDQNNTRQLLVCACITIEHNDPLRRTEVKVMNRRLFPPHMLVTTVVKHLLTLQLSIKVYIKCLL